MQFDEAIAYLLSLGHETLTVKLGLRNTELLLEALGNPHKEFFSVQIAGTNGKGSTAAFADSIVRAAGLRSGLYTSPHLVSMTERIRIDGSEITHERFAQLATEVRVACETLMAQQTLSTYPTFFEQVTAIALLAFKQAGVDLAILETGLGGRLDATTCAAARVVAITPIGLDHQEYLGETIEQIAAEKAATIRPGVRALVSPQTPIVQEVIQRAAAVSKVDPTYDENRIDLEDSTGDGRFCVSFHTRTSGYRRVWLSLRGRHQITNASLALLIAEVLRAEGFVIQHNAVIKGLEQAQHPGRLEFISAKPAVLYDGAHNPAGARALREYLDEFALRPLTMVFGAMGDKKLDQMAEILFPLADHLILTPVDSPRSASVEILRQLASSTLEADQITCTNSVKEAATTAIAKTDPQGLICFNGSLYLIGEAKRYCSFNLACAGP
jgi:dihydrofolate synthase/folylpolyglutamate synthase